jgi:hypothetical protein
MEGYTLKRKLRELLSEVTNGTFMNDRTTYDYLYAAVNDFNFRTHYVTGTQTIPISATVSAYNLNPDFVGLALMDRDNRPYIKWTVGGSDSFITPRDYASQIQEDSTTTSSIADGFSITNAPQSSNITGKATSDGVILNGECLLIDTSADFSTVAIGDYVHNTTDDSNGVVVGIPASGITCALFEGTLNQWTTGDDYIVVPQTRYSIVFTPIPSAPATATVYYIKAPAPVYSPYQVYSLPFQYDIPIVEYAAFLYKYRDREPDFGDALYKHYDIATRKFAAEMRKGIPEKSGFRCSFKKISPRSRTMGGFYRG